MIRTSRHIRLLINFSISLACLLASGGAFAQLPTAPLPAPPPSPDGGGTRPPGAPPPPVPGTGGPMVCAEGPGPGTVAGGFIYAGGGASDLNGDVTCFSASDADWKVVTTRHGQFKRQTLADKWPDGEFFVDEQGRRMQSYNTYEGFRRHPVKDDVQLATLDPLGRVARSSCLLYTSDAADE